VWLEDGVFPQVIFEVTSPSNTDEEMRAKRAFYFGHGAEEYYEFDPEAGIWTGFVCDPATGVPEPVPQMDGYTSPRLGMRFGFRPLELLVYRPDGSRFLSFQELEEQRLAERRRADRAERRLDEERTRAEDAQRRLDEERTRAEDAQRRLDEERTRAEDAQRRLDEERTRAEDAQRRLDEQRIAAEQARRETERVRALLRAAGIDPDATP
jgi:hypothetical protein